MSNPPYQNPRAASVASAVAKPSTLAEQFGVGRVADVSLSTGDLCMQLGDRVTRAARPSIPPKRRAPLPTRDVAPPQAAALSTMLPGLPSAVLQLLDEIESYDRSGSGRAHAVAQQAVAIARSLVPAGELARIRHAALLCNIGLAAVPQAILQKAESLTPAERQLVRRHPISSAEILHDIPALADLIPLVLHHHEAYGGNGYPYGLSGAWIPQGARIIRVAETYEALLRAQPYRPALAPLEALTLLRAGAGEQFDPACVEALATWLVGGAPQDETLTRWWESRQASAH